MDKYIKEDSGAGDWGTDKARAKLQQDSPGQKIKRKGKMKRFREVLEGTVVETPIEEGTLPPALQAYQDKKNGKKPKDDEKEVEEAMSPADKAKRLKMIRQAVEKMNSANMEKAKKDALKMMKDSGMFDEELEEAVDNWVVTVAKPVNKLKKGAEQKVKARSAFEAINKAMKLWGDPALKAAPMNSFSIQKEGFRPVPMFEDMSIETFAKFYS